MKAELMHNIDVRLYMLAILLPLILVNWIRNLKFLAPCSTVANFITFISFGIILYYIFREPLTFEHREVIGNVENFPLYFGTVLFALEAIGVILPLENEMKKPKVFMRTFGVLNIGMGTIVFLYTGLGFFGYIRYGSAIEGSITLSLNEPLILAKSVQILLAIAIFFTHPIQCYVAIDIAWNEYIAPNFEKNSHKVLWEYVVRTSLVLLTFLLAVVIPELDLFISLFGALCLSGLGLAFPAIIQICTFWHTCDRTGKAIMLAKNMSLVLFALLGFVGEEEEKKEEAEERTKGRKERWKNESDEDENAANVIKNPSNFSSSSNKLLHKNFCTKELKEPSKLRTTD
ncbi:Proton-coupled amino acid transporter 1 [Melipona quadrifasciata]|uniref:Proton-coupled amino acid transporter 1 n=1 Tax=Melipona quadrifasciata TaxID=166423 RepID=A0A0M8ZPP6_9HYME|nr:Proton-coupled amino acid transporter 1 [Melipona quadrifasciata]